MTGKSKRGFASMDQAKQREIASKGGKAAHQKGTAHEFTKRLAEIAPTWQLSDGKGAKILTKAVAKTQTPKKIPQPTSL